MKKLFIIACALFMFAACGKNNGNGGENPEGDIYGYGKILEEVRDWLEVEDYSFENFYDDNDRKNLIRTDTTYKWLYDGKYTREWTFENGKVKNPGNDYIPYYIKVNEYRYYKEDPKYFEISVSYTNIILKSTGVTSDKETTVHQKKLIPKKDWKGN